MRIAKGALLALASFGAVASAQANAQSRTTINFTGPTGTLIGSTYANQGVSFSGAYFFFGEASPNNGNVGYGTGAFSATFSIPVQYLSITAGGYGTIFVAGATSPSSGTFNGEANGFASTPLVATGSNITGFRLEGDPGYITSITFGSLVAPTPEPATWAMMILGFGAVGTALRRRQKITTRVTYA